MKIGVIGKGGTGKTTLSALLAQAYAEQGKQVVAVDTDSNPNLAMSLGLDEQTGAGCMCAGHTGVRSLLGTTLEEHADVAVVDMEAGLEHLSRSGGTLAHVDVLLIVTEPTRKSLLTASRTTALARELGVVRVAGVGNKARGEDTEYLERLADDYGMRLAALRDR